MSGDRIQGQTAQELRRRTRSVAPSSPVYEQAAPKASTPNPALLPLKVSGQRMDGFASRQQVMADPLAVIAVAAPTIIANPGQSFEIITQKPRRDIRARTQKITLPFATAPQPPVAAKLQPEATVDVSPSQPIRAIQPVPVVKTQPSSVLRRQAVRPLSSKVAAKAGHSKGQWAIMAMAVFVFATGLAVSISTIQTNHSAKAQVSAISRKAEDGSDASSGSSSTPPSEVKPTPQAITTYAVAPDLPRYIDIGKLKVHARIKPMTVLRDGSLQAPSSIYDAGWYNASAKPGDSAGNGAMLLDGHVLGATYPAVFSKIKTLVSGDQISVSRGDGQVLTYQVVKVQNYDASSLDVGMLLTSIQPGRPGLNLITCGGKYLPKQQTFDQRTVVFAVQI